MLRTVNRMRRPVCILDVSNLLAFLLRYLTISIPAAGRVCSSSYYMHNLSY